jgi:hypothetical protein
VAEKVKKKGPGGERPGLDLSSKKTDPWMT